MVSFSSWIIEQLQDTLVFVFMAQNKNIFPPLCVRGLVGIIKGRGGLDLRLDELVLVGLRWF